MFYVIHPRIHSFYFMVCSTFPRRYVNHKRTPHEDYEDLSCTQWNNGYHTDTEYRQCEENGNEHCSGPGYRNPRSVIMMKNENNGKLDNVDAYFVDTLNKSMAERANQSAPRRSFEHTYAEPTTKHKKEAKFVNAPTLNEDENELERIGNECHSSSSSAKKLASSSNRTAYPTNALNFNLNSNDNSSSDSCGSSFVPAGAKLLKVCGSAPHELEQVRSRPVRSSSTCSMPEFAKLASFCFNNSESMPNITSNANATRVLTASQLNSSLSLSESDNMSEQSGYVSSRKSSAGSTTQVSPAGEISSVECWLSKMTGNFCFDIQSFSVYLLETKFFFLSLVFSVAKTHRLFYLNTVGAKI